MFNVCRSAGSKATACDGAGSRPHGRVWRSGLPPTVGSCSGSRPWALLPRPFWAQSSAEPVRHPCRPGARRRCGRKSHADEHRARDGECPPVGRGRCFQQQCGLVSEAQQNRTDTAGARPVTEPSAPSPEPAGAEGRQLRLCPCCLLGGLYQAAGRAACGCRADSEHLSRGGRGPP